MNKTTRINKYLTEANFCSRREADRLIIEGRVRINDKEAKLGDQVNKIDTVFVDGKSIVNDKDSKVYLVYNKPVGIISTTSDNSRDNIISAIGYKQRIFPIGRLDVASSGLILLTNDGDIVNQILRSEEKIEKEYLVRLNKNITQELVNSLRAGVDIGDYVTLPAIVKKESNRELRITIIEGKNRQIRRMLTANEYSVVSLKRIRIGKLELADLPLGEYYEISYNKLTKLVF